MLDSYTKERKEELLWYGFGEGEAEILSYRVHDILLEQRGIFALVLNNDLRYGITLSGTWHGLQEMKELFAHLKSWELILRHIAASPHDEWHLVPPGKILTRDGDIVYFFFEKGEHKMFLDDSFSIAQAQSIQQYLQEFSTRIDILIERNAKKREEG